MTSSFTYDQMRHFADSWGLAAMVLVFAVLILWPFRPGANRHNQRAATMIFDDDIAEGGKGHD